MIKYLLPIMLLLASCSSTKDYAEILVNFVNLKPDNIKPTSILDSTPYNRNNKFLNITYNNIDQTLQYSKNLNDRKYWIAESQILVTLHSKIIKSFGYTNNFEYINHPNIENIAKDLINKKQSRVSKQTYIRYTNPETTYLKIELTYQISADVKHPDYFVIEELQEVKKIKFKSKNYYWVDQDINTYFSIQNPIPKTIIQIL